MAWWSQQALKVPMRGGSISEIDEDFGVKLCETIAGLLASVFTTSDGEFCAEEHLNST